MAQISSSRSSVAVSSLSSLDICLIAYTALPFFFLDARRRMDDRRKALLGSVQPATTLSMHLDT